MLSFRPVKKLSIVIPFFNERENLDRIYDECTRMYRTSLPEYEIEYLFMDNHSTDGSFDVAARLAQSNPQVKVVRLSRNFGYQANILMGYVQSSGDAVIQLDADGEDDPALIPQLVRKWEAGYRVVYGVRRTRAESSLMTLQRKLFYRAVNALSTVAIPVDAGDFRLMDRQVIEAIKHFKESKIYLRGLIAFAGFEQIGITYDRRPRFKGESKFSWWDYVSLAWTGLVSFSSKPLRLVTWLGLLISGVSFAGFLFYLWLYFFSGVPVRGFTTLILVQLLLAGVQLLCVGLMGSYIGFIFDEVKRRPQGIIECIQTGDQKTFPVMTPE